MLTYIHQCTEGFFRPDGHFFFVCYAFSLSVVYEWAVLGWVRQKETETTEQIVQKKNYYDGERALFFFAIKLFN